MGRLVTKGTNEIHGNYLPMVTNVKGRMNRCSFGWNWGVYRVPCLGAVTRDVSGMSLVENPSKRLGEVIGRIDSSRDVKQLNVTPGFPILNSEEPNIVDLYSESSADKLTDGKENQAVID